MKNTKTAFFCSDCGNETSKWFGRCPACGAWNTLVEEVKVTKASSSPSSLTVTSSLHKAPSKLNEIAINAENRDLTGIDEFDRVLGGGLVVGSLVLVGGDPGIGKSTLLLQVCANLTKQKKVLYFSGEESEKQLKLRADRLNINADNLYISSQVNMDIILENIDNLKPDIVVVDSIQTMFVPDISSATGSVSQVREVTMRLMRKAKENAVSIFVVGHVTKDGGIAGPKVLEHMVDCVLYFEGERYQNCRILRSVKNRFGSTNEIGIFEMHDTGLYQVTNPSMMFLDGRPDNISGTSVVCTLEGTRPILAEIQALVTKTAFGMPRRTSTGIDYNRIAMLIAVLEKRVEIHLTNFDSYVNVIGGLRIDEPAADLAVICAIASAYRNFVIPDSCVLIGEVGLTGELRTVHGLDKRIAELEKLGFKKCIVPKSGEKALARIKDCKIEILFARNVVEALAFLR